MNGRERTLAFLEGRPVDHIPFHPLVMRYAAECTGVNYRDYCRDYRSQSRAMIGFADRWGLDWLHPGGWPYCEAAAYGLELAFPDNAIPFAKQPLLREEEPEVEKLQPLDIEGSETMMNRVECIRFEKETVGDRFFLAGHCEGPLAEYADLRGTEHALMDLLESPELVEQAFRVITDNAKRWILLQAQAGADCLSVGDAICSQIGQDLYVELVKPFHREIAEYASSLGLYTKFHICGNITHLIPHLLEIGVDMIDIDHMVTLKQDFFEAMAPGQFFCGNIDPVAVLRYGTPETVRAAVELLREKSRGKIILGSGCEVPPGTPGENYAAFCDAACRWQVPDRKLPV